MEYYAQELDILTVTLTPDIKPYIFEPSALLEHLENSGPEENANWGSETIMLAPMHITSLNPSGS